MFKFCLYLIALTTFPLFACKKGSEGSSGNNKAPVVSLTANLVGANPFKFQFKATANDQEFDPLTYEWDFGDGVKRPGDDSEEFTFNENQTVTVKVYVTDKKSAPVSASTTVNTNVVPVTINPAQTFQTMEGFGGFGAQDNPWSNGPFTSPAFVDALVNDLGLTIVRDEVPTNFEINNDNNDPFVTNLAGYNINTDVSGHHRPMGTRIQYYKDMKAAGVKTFIASVWSPPPWMKHNNGLTNGTNQNAAPGYTSSPGPTTNQLKVDMYNEFAEMCVAYIKIFKQETGIDLYAFSIQNEPRFSQSYQSCVYDGNALRDLVKVVGKRFADENIQTKLFLPEDVGWLGGVESMTKPTLDDPVARSYTDIIAVHGYDLDGITANSPSAQTWNTMYNWGAPYGIPLWMTETSGFANTPDGAIDLAKAMYTAIRHGNVSAWVFWSLAGPDLNEYNLLSSSLIKSKRYYASKNFYRYIRPGAVRMAADAPENTGVLPLAFTHQAEGSTTLVFVNTDKNSGRAIKINGGALPATFKKFVTSAQDDCKDYGNVNSGEVILLPANSVTTLYFKN